MGFLDGGIAAIMASAFSPLYLDGSLYRRTLNDDGKGGYTSADQAPVSIKLQVDDATEAMRGEAGYTATDVRLIILANGIGDVDTDCEVVVSGKRYSVASVKQDPARSYFECRGAVAT